MKVLQPATEQSYIKQMRSGIIVLATLLGACTTTGSLGGWDHRLRGDALVLLGEVHDNAQQHQLRLAALQRAFASGWRPAIAMEQFDREQQADIDRARLERPGDAQHLIDVAGPSGTRAGSGWNWAFYRPFVELALRYDVLTCPWIFGPIIPGRRLGWGRGDAAA